MKKLTMYLCWLHRCNRTAGGFVCLSSSAVYGESAGPAVPCYSHNVSKNKLTKMQPLYLTHCYKHTEVVLYSWPTTNVKAVWIISDILFFRNFSSGIALPCSSSVYGQDPNSSAFNWFGVANQGQRFSHSSLERKVSGLTQTQQAWQHALLKRSVTVIQKHTDC